MRKWEYSVYGETNQTSETWSCQDEKQTDTEGENPVSHCNAGTEWEVLCEFVLHRCGRKHITNSKQKHRH